MTRQQPYISPQEDQNWTWPEWSSKEVMEWDSRSEPGSSAWFQVDLELLEGNQQQSME